MRYLDGPRPRLFAHRGGARIAPENTIEAFAAGLAAGADRLEMDVHATRDGHVVVLHDPTVDRTTDGSGLVREMTLAELHRSFRRPDPFGGDEWPPALVPLAHLGDGAYACVDAASLTAEIVVFDPAGPGDELVPAGQSLEEWLRGWLDR